MLRKPACMEIDSCRTDVPSPDVLPLLPQPTKSERHKHNAVSIPMYFLFLITVASPLRRKFTKRRFIKCITRMAFFQCIRFYLHRAKGACRKYEKMPHPFKRGAAQVVSFTSRVLNIRPERLFRVRRIFPCCTFSCSFRHTVSAFPKY